MPDPKKPINPFAAITDSPIAPKTPSPARIGWDDILMVFVIVVAYFVYPPLAVLAVILWMIDEIRQTRR